MCERVLRDKARTIPSLTSGRSRPIGCFIYCIVHFPQNSPITSGSFAENDLQLDASCGCSPPCTLRARGTGMTHSCSVLHCIAEHLKTLCRSQLRMRALKKRERTERCVAACCNSTIADNSSACLEMTGAREKGTCAATDAECAADAECGATAVLAHSSACVP